MTANAEVQSAGCAPTVLAPTIAADRAAHLGRVFKALGDPTRLQILSMIAAHEDGTACVCDLNAPLTLSQPTVSHHLRVLREAGLVSSERRGTWVHYRLVEEALAEVGVGHLFTYEQARRPAL